MGCHGRICRGTRRPQDTLRAVRPPLRRRSRCQARHRLHQGERAARRSAPAYEHRSRLPRHRPTYLCSSSPLSRARPSRAAQRRASRARISSSSSIPKPRRPRRRPRPPPAGARSTQSSSPQRPPPRGPRSPLPRPPRGPPLQGQRSLPACQRLRLQPRRLGPQRPQQQLLSPQRPSRRLRPPRCTAATRSGSSTPAWSGASDDGEGGGHDSATNPPPRPPLPRAAQGAAVSGAHLGPREGHVVRHRVL